jgi:hypothetical protein
MYRICVAFLCGLGLTFLVCLLLNIPVANLFLLMLFSPGAIVLNILLSANDWNIPALLATNAFIYSMLALLVILLRYRDVTAGVLKQTTVRLVAPVAVLSSLACFHTLNPLLPVGIAELSRQENDLQQSLPLNIGVNDARQVLTAKGIHFGDSLEQAETVVLQSNNKKITASAGDRVLVSRFQTSARQFPCGFDMELVLLFGSDQKLKDRYINRFPMCP